MLVNGIKIEGVCIAGDATNIRFPGPGFMFDMGRCELDSVKISRLFLTHGHPDHVGGIVNYLFQRHFRKMSVPKIWLPPHLIKPLRSAVNIFSSLHSTFYKAEFIPVEIGKRYKIKESLYLEAIPAVHSIPTLAYLLYRSESAVTPFICYSSDTSIEILDRNPILYSAEALILECTFIDSGDTLQKAIEKTHIHSSQIYERASLFENKELVLTHISARYDREEIKQEMLRSAPESLRHRIQIFR